MGFGNDLNKETLSDDVLKKLSGGAGNKSSDLPQIDINPEILPKTHMFPKNKEGDNEEYLTSKK